MNQDTALDTTSATSSPATDPDVITSVADFIAKIVQIEGEDGAEIFYRGHADASWSLTPSIFRTPKGVEKEHLLFRDMVARMPQSFSGCKSALDYLVQMQHYELPTRLLDVSTNPLVALYFACVKADATGKEKLIAGLDAALRVALSSYPHPKDLQRYAGQMGAVGAIMSILSEAATIDNRESEVLLTDAIGSDQLKDIGVNDPIRLAIEAGKNAGEKARSKDGMVYLFSIPDTKVKYYDSDTVSILASLARCKANEVDISLYAPKKNKGYFTEGLCSDDEQEFLWGRLHLHEMRYHGVIPHESQESLANDKSWISKIWEDIILKTPIHEIGSTYLAQFNKERGIQSLLYQIRGEKPHFQALIQPCDLVNIFLVKAKNDNPRIINQSGAFLLFGLGLYLGKGPDGSQEALRCGKNEPAVIPSAWIARKFRVPAEKKETILKELARMGITESYLFPEMEKYAKELKKKYGGQAK
nr:FRG domain-containing protein [uncultured Porphyromonas sp.]